MEQTCVIPSSAGRSAVIDRVKRCVDALSAECAWSVKIAPHRPQRSQQQNRYLFGVVYAEIMKHLEGWAVEDIHDYCLGEWSGWETIEGFGRKRMKPVRRSSKLNKQEFADFVADIQRRMAERGIFIPDPEL